MTTGVVSLFRATSRGEVRPQGGALAPTLGALWEWLEREVLTSPLLRFEQKTVSNYRRTRALTLAVLGEEHPSNIDIMRGMARLSRAPFSLAASTIHFHFRQLRALYVRGGQAGRDVVSGNPCAFVEVMRPEPRPHAIVNIVDVLPVLLDTLSDARARAFVLFERYIGRRRGEVLALRRDDLVRESADVWRIEVTHQRNTPNKWTRTPLKNSRGGERSVPVRRGVHPLFEVIEALVRMPVARVRVGRGGGRVVEAPEGLLFPYREHDLNRMMRGFRAAAPLAFPPGRAWHVFRHTLAVELHRRGKGDDDIAEVLGHSSTHVTRSTYMGVWGQRVRESVFEGVWETAPPGGGAQVSETAGVRAPAVSKRRGTKGSPSITKENTACHTSGQKRSQQKQRALPGLAAGPLTTKPLRGGSAKPARR